MRLYGREYSKDEICRRAGDMSQIAGIKAYTFNEGYEKGVDAFDVKTGNGLSFTVLPGRAMDIAQLDYNGKPIGYITKAGIKNSNYYSPQGFEWLRNFTGGLLTTCGLTHVGPPERQGIWELGLHGRVSNIPAFEVCHKAQWDGDDYVFTLEGKMREAVLYEENILLTRRIVAKAGEKIITIYDEIENQGYVEVPLMILYHMNFGFPLVDKGSRVIVPAINTEARDEQILKDIKEWSVMSLPETDAQTQVFFHDVQAHNDGYASIGIINENMGYGIKITYDKKVLPYLTQWKNMQCQDYVIGLEPGNCQPIGRSASREKSALEFLNPGEKKKITLRIEILEGVEEIKKI